MEAGEVVRELYDVTEVVARLSQLGDMIEEAMAMEDHEYTLEEQVTILQNKMARMEYREKEAAEREAQCKVEIEKLKLRMSKLEKEKNAIEENLESLKNKKEAKQKIGHLKEKLDSKEKENEDLKSQTKKFECVVAELRREIQLKEELKKNNTGKFISFRSLFVWHHYLPYKEGNDLL